MNYRCKDPLQLSQMRHIYFLLLFLSHGKDENLNACNVNVDYTAAHFNQLRYSNI